MSNLRGAMVPTATLIPRVETTDMRRWKIVGVWKKRDVTGMDPPDEDDDIRISSSSSSSEDESDEGEAAAARRREKAMRGLRRSGGGGGNPSRGNGIHEMDLGTGMPPLSGSAEGSDLENVSPVRIEAWMTKVFHYAQDSETTGDTTVMRKMFCILTITPVRNFNLAEYLRHSIVENSQVIYHALDGAGLKCERADCNPFLTGYDVPRDVAKCV